FVFAEAEKGPGRRIPGRKDGGLAIGVARFLVILQFVEGTRQVAPALHPVWLLADGLAIESGGFFIVAGFPCCLGARGKFGEVVSLAHLGKYRKRGAEKAYKG